MALYLFLIAVPEQHVCNGPHHRHYVYRCLQRAIDIEKTVCSHPRRALDNCGNSLCRTYSKIRSFLSRTSLFCNVLGSRFPFLGDTVCAFACPSAYSLDRDIGAADPSQNGAQEMAILAASSLSILWARLCTHIVLFVIAGYLREFLCQSEFVCLSCYWAFLYGPAHPPLLINTQQSNSRYCYCQNISSSRRYNLSIGEMVHCTGGWKQAMPHKETRCHGSFYFVQLRRY